MISTLLDFALLASINLTEFFSWYGVGYLCTIVLGIMLLIISMMGLGDHDVSTDHDVDHDLDHDVDHNLEHEAETEHDASHEGEHDHDAEHDSHFFHNILSILGIGHCPLSVIIMTFFFTFTLLGVISLLITKSVFSSEMIYGLTSYGLSFVGTFFLTGTIARFLGKIMPTSETAIKRNKDLIGKIGEALYSFDETKNTGFIQIYDDNGSLIEKGATNSDPHKLISKGDKVLIVDWDPVNEKFSVCKAPIELQQ